LACTEYSIRILFGPNSRPNGVFVLGRIILIKIDCSSEKLHYVCLNNHLQYKHPEHKSVKLATNAKKLEIVPPDADAGQRQPTLAEFVAKRKT